MISFSFNTFHSTGPVRTPKLNILHYYLTEFFDILNCYFDCFYVEQDVYFTWQLRSGLKKRKIRLKIFLD